MGCGQTRFSYARERITTRCAWRGHARAPGHGWATDKKSPQRFHCGLRPSVRGCRPEHIRPRVLLYAAFRPYGSAGVGRTLPPQMNAEIAGGRCGSCRSRITIPVCSPSLACCTSSLVTILVLPIYGGAHRLVRTCARAVAVRHALRHGAYHVTAKRKLLRENGLPTYSSCSERAAVSFLGRSSVSVRHVRRHAR